MISDHIIIRRYADSFQLTLWFASLFSEDFFCNDRINSLSSARLSHPLPSPLAHPGLRMTPLAGSTIERKEIDESNPTCCNIVRRSNFFCSLVVIDDKAVDTLCGDVITLLKANTEDDAARVRISSRNIAIWSQWWTWYGRVNHLDTNPVIKRAKKGGGYWLGGG